MAYCSRCKVHGHSFATCRRGKGTAKMAQPEHTTDLSSIPKPQGNQRVREGAGQVSVGGVESKPAPGKDPKPKVKGNDQWVQVTSRKERKKGVVGTPAAEDLADKIQDNTDSLALVVYAGESPDASLCNTNAQNPSHIVAKQTFMQPPVGVTLHAENGMPNMCPTSGQAPSHDENTPSLLEEIPDGSPQKALTRKVPNDLSLAELRLKSAKQTSAEVFLDKDLDLYVHPAGIERYNQIQEKARLSCPVGTLENQPSKIPCLSKAKEDGKSLDSRKDCIASGSKHCLIQSGQ